MTDTSKLPPSFGLIIIGDEILSGKRADKHLPKFVELLGARGLTGVRRMLGRVSARVVAEAPCTATVVRVRGEPQAS